MARLVTKFQYIKPGGSINKGGYAKYIATREGVEKIDDSQKNNPATKKQTDIISKLLTDFPGTEQMLEYEDYLDNPTIGNASEFISRAFDENKHRISADKTYADYIATRPRAEKIGTHGLFSDEGEVVNLNRVSEELKAFKGNMWTVIISLRREDAEKLGYDNGSKWRELLRSEAINIAENFKIEPEDLKWYAAFHNEGHHPHVHMIVYSDGKSEPYLSRKGIDNLRSSFAKTIFADEMLNVYKAETEFRDQLRKYSKDVLTQVQGTNSIIEMKFLELAKNLQAEKQGTRYYKYLKPELKQQVDDIAELISRDETVADLYDKWYLEKEKVLLLYEDTLPERIPLAQNDEFRSIKNAIISEAKHYVESIYDISHEFFKINNNENRSDNASDVKFYDVANLINQIASIIESKTFDIRTEYHGKTDKKLLREIAERKLASGQKF